VDSFFVTHGSIFDVTVPFLPVVNPARLWYTLAVPIIILYNHRLLTPLLSMQQQHKCLLSLGTSIRFSVTVLLTA